MVKTHKGFTLPEILISILLTAIIVMLVFQMYRASMMTFRTAQRELQWLAAFRAGTDKLERELGSMVWKASYLPTAGESVTGFSQPVPKYIDGGIFPILFEKRYIGFYTSLDGKKIHRVEYYFNPAERRLLWNDGLDNDNDDPNNGLGLLIDDKGSFMIKRTEDADLTYTNFSDPFFPPAFTRPPYDAKVVDHGHILNDGIWAVEFSYIFLTKDINDKVLPVFQYADRWPYDNDADPKNGDLTKLVRPDDDVNLRKGLSYLTPPLAVHVDFIFKEGGFTKTMSKTIYLYGSLWNKWMNDDRTGIIP